MKDILPPVCVLIKMYLLRVLYVYFPVCAYMLCACVFIHSSPCQCFFLFPIENRVLGETWWSRLQSTDRRKLPACGPAAVYLLPDETGLQSWARDKRQTASSLDAELHMKSFPLFVVLWCNIIGSNVMHVVVWKAFKAMPQLCLIYTSLN